MGPPGVAIPLDVRSWSGAIPQIDVEDRGGPSAFESI